MTAVDTLLFGRTPEARLRTALQAARSQARLLDLAKYKLDQADTALACGDLDGASRLMGHADRLRAKARSYDEVVEWGLSA